MTDSCQRTTEDMKGDEKVVACGQTETEFREKTDSVASEKMKIKSI